MRDCKMHLKGNHMLQTSAGPNGYVGSSGDVEFTDPAILKVGKGTLATGMENPGIDVMQSSSPRLSPYHSDARIQLLTQQSISAYQKLMFPDQLRNRFSRLDDVYNLLPMLMDQGQTYNPST